MITNLDIWRAANLLIRRYGPEAELEASRRADRMLERGDHDGQLIWTEIKQTIAILQAKPESKH